MINQKKKTQAKMTLYFKSRNRNTRKMMQNRILTPLHIMIKVKWNLLNILKSVLMT